MCEAVTGRRKEVGKCKVVESGELKRVQDSVICRGFLILASLWSPGELIPQAVGGVAKTPYKQGLKPEGPSLRPMGAACGLCKYLISGLVVGERVLGSQDC
jgi:hypothetical protein